MIPRVYVLTTIMKKTPEVITEVYVLKVIIRAQKEQLNTNLIYITKLCVPIRLLV